MTFLFVLSIPFRILLSLLAIALSPVLNLIPSRVRRLFGTPYWRRGIYKPYRRWDAES